MSVRQRLTALERAAGVTGGPWCECPGVRFVWPDGSPALPFCGGDADLAPPEPDEDAVCPKCGKPVQNIMIVWQEDSLKEQEQ